MKKLLVALALAFVVFTGTVQTQEVPQPQLCAMFVLNLSEYEALAWYEVDAYDAEGFLGVVPSGGHSEVYGPCVDTPVRVIVVSSDPDNTEHIFEMRFTKNPDGTFHEHVFAIIMTQTQVPMILPQV